MLKLKVELLTKGLKLDELDIALRDSHIVDIKPLRLKVDGREQKVNQSAMYTAYFEKNKFSVITIELPSGLTKIELSYEYSGNKFRSAKKFGNFLSKFTEFLGKKYFKYSYISNDLSEYFLERLYPKVQNYELKLRKIFILALSPLEDDQVIKIIKENTNDKVDLSKIHTAESVEKLQIGELHYLIFELNLNPINNLHEHFENFQARNEVELKKMVKTALPTTIWDKHFSSFLKNSESSVLPGTYNQIREYRNNIMHFHTIHYRRYQKIDKLLSSAIQELEVLEQNMLLKWNLESTRGLINDISSQELLENMRKILMETIVPAVNTIYANNTNVNVALKSLMENFIQVPKIDSSIFKGITSGLGQLPLSSDFDKE